jgi:hypothetical protein
MDDLVQPPDLGLPKPSERRKLRALRQPKRDTLQRYRDGAGLQAIGPHFDDHAILAGIIRIWTGEPGAPGP